MANLMVQTTALVTLVTLMTTLSACLQGAGPGAATPSEAEPAESAAPSGAASVRGLPTGVQTAELCFPVQNPPSGLGGPTTTYFLRGTLFNRGPLRDDSIAIIFGHGGAWDAASWLRNPEHVIPFALAEAGYATLIYDRLGQGESRPASGGPMHGWTFVDHVDMLHQLIRHLKQGTAARAEDGRCDGAPARAESPISRVVLTGVSMGGAIADSYAGRFGDVDAIIPQDWSNMGANPEPQAFIAKALTTLDEQGYALFPAFKEDCRALVFYEPGADADLVDRTCLGAFRRGAASELPNILRVQATVREDVKGVPARMPVLLTFADESLPFKPKDQSLPDSRADEYAYWKENCGCRDRVETWTQKDAGHAMHMHKTAATWTARVLAFLEKNGLPGSGANEGA